jgi:hypothetical protein
MATPEGPQTKKQRTDQCQPGSSENHAAVQQAEGQTQVSVCILHMVLLAMHPAHDCYLPCVHADAHSLVVACARRVLRLQLPALLWDPNSPSAASRWACSARCQRMRVHMLTFPSWLLSYRCLSWMQSPQMAMKCGLRSVRTPPCTRCSLTSRR